MRKLIIGIAIAAALSFPFAPDVAADQSHACSGTDTARAASASSGGGGVLEGRTQADEQSALGECFGED